MAMQSMAKPVLKLGQENPTKTNAKMVVLAFVFVVISY
jgi:hypothetical protein